MIPKALSGSKSLHQPNRNYVARKSRFVPRVDRIYVAMLSATPRVNPPTARLKKSDHSSWFLRASKRPPAGRPASTSSR